MLRSRHNKECLCAADRAIMVTVRSHTETRLRRANSPRQPLLREVRFQENRCLRGCTAAALESAQKERAGSDASPRQWTGQNLRCTPNSLQIDRGMNVALGAKNPIG